MAAYYNENDLKTAAWLRELIKAGLIADGEVDTRSIVDVQPSDLAGFVQCHFFAGIGGWSYALRLAGWSDERPVWTGSCPCQPFSSAGAQAGGADPRDLWPTWRVLIAECRPSVVFGEQVESAIGHGWLDRLHDDLEAEDYAIGPIGLPSACVGAFDIRQRLWFVADADGRQSSDGGLQRSGQHLQRSQNGDACELADAQSERGQRLSTKGWSDLPDGPGRCETGDVADATGRGLGIDRSAPRRDGYAHVGCEDCDWPCGEGRSFNCWRTIIRKLEDAACKRSEDALHQRGDVSAPASGGQAGHLGGAGASFWTDADWLECTDGKARPVEPGTFPLAYGLPARVGRLRGYGNAINPWVAAEVIAAYMEIVDEGRLTP